MNPHDSQTAQFYIFQSILATKMKKSLNQLNHSQSVQTPYTIWKMGKLTA